MTAQVWRRVVQKVRAATGVSERRAIRFTGFPASPMRYRSLRDLQEELRARIKALALQWPRWGYRCIHDLLRREGWAVNRKRVQRIYREEGLAVRPKGKKRRSQAPWVVHAPLTRPNERWTMDFIFRDDCLNMHWFQSLPEARGTIEA